MLKGHFPLYIILCVFAVYLCSCSTTKMLPDGALRLKDNKIDVINLDSKPDFNSSDLESYVRQKPNTYPIGYWSPFLYIYNWSNGKGKGWDKFVQRLGQAPIVFDSLLVTKSIPNMLTHLQFQGYYDSDIQDFLDVDNENAIVTYKVKLGKQYPIKDIKYKIEDDSLRMIYLSDTSDVLIKIGQPLSEKVLDKESERITAIFRDKGYFRFTKNHFFFSADTISVKDSALLTVEIRNYTRNEDEKKAIPHRPYYVRNVNIYPVSNVLKYRASIADNQQYSVDTLKYNGLTFMYDNILRIRPGVLDNITHIVPGQKYSESLVNSTYQRFTNLRLFTSVNIEMDEVEEGVVDCNVRLLPSKLQGYKVNLEASINSTGLFGVAPALSYYHRNIFKGGEWLNVGLTGNFQFKLNDPVKSTEFGITSSLSFPKFLLLSDKLFKNTLPRTELSVAYNFQDRLEYTRNMIGAEYGYNWSTMSNNHFFEVNPVQLNVVKMFNVSDEFREAIAKDRFLEASYKNHFDLGLGANYFYTSDAAPVPKNTYLKANIKLDIAGNLLSVFDKYMIYDAENEHNTIWGTPYSQYSKIETYIVKTWFLDKKSKHSIALRGLAGLGYSYGNSYAMPFEELFWAGGANSMRGWQARTIGPGSEVPDSTFSIPNQGGDLRLEANLEYRFPLFWLLEGAVFFDAGNVWNVKEPSTKEFYNSIALNTGLGLRFNVQFVIIRLDMGIKLYEPSSGRWRVTEEWFKNDGCAFQFGIGYPF